MPVTSPSSSTFIDHWTGNATVKTGFSGGGGGGAAPVNVTAPQIVSNMVVGVPMSVVPGTYTGTVTGRSYQWKKAGVPISGATSATYNAVTGDAQGVITVDEVASNGGSAAAAVTSASVICAPASAAYATALAAVSAGQYFSSPSVDANRLNIHQKVGSVGVMVARTPANGSVNAIAALIRALPALPGAPLTHFDSSDVYYGVNQFQNRASGAPAVGINLLGSFTYNNAGGVVAGGLSITPRSADSVSANNGIRCAIASGAVAASTYTIGVRIPPGTWTLAFKARTTGAGSTQGIQFQTGALGGVAGQAAALTATAQQFSKTFNQTSEATVNMVFVHGDYPAVTSVAYDFTIEDLQLVPGSTPLASADITPHPAIYTINDLVMSSGGMELEALANAPTASNMLIAKAPLQNLTAWTHIMVCRADVGTNAGAAFGMMPSTAGVSARMTQTQTTITPQSTITGIVEKGAHYGNAAAAGKCVTWTTVCDGTNVLTYVNGALFSSIPGAVGSITNFGAVTFNALWTAGTQAASFNFLGDMSAAAFYTSALSAAQVAAAHTALAAQITAKGLTLQAQKNGLLVSGDSISFGYQDLAPAGGAYLRAACAIATTPRLQAAMQAVVGDSLSNLQSRQAQAQAIIAGWIAGGVRPIQAVMIGTNDDASSLITQAGCDAYYASLKTYWAQQKAAAVTAGGTLYLIACTVTCNGRTPAFEGTGWAAGGGTSVTAAATAAAVAAGISGQNFAGWRYYLNALIRSNTALYDVLCDWANTAGMTSYDTAVSGSNMFDTVHPNSAGYVLYQATVQAAITSVMAP